MPGNPDRILIEMSVELTEALLMNAAGWDVVKRARAYLEQGHVLSSYWAPPLLRGVVVDGVVDLFLQGTGGNRHGASVAHGAGGGADAPSAAANVAA